MGTPGYVDLVVVVGLALLLWYILRILRRISDNWKKMMKERIDAAMELRKRVKDPFRNTYGYSWDYCMVFDIVPAEDKMKPVQQENSLKMMIGRLTDAGLQIKLFYSVQRDEIYLKIRAPLKRLLREADRLDYRLALEPTALANKLREGNMKGKLEKRWKPVQVPSSSKETTIDPYDYIYTEYRKNGNMELFKTYPNDSILRGVDRLKLMYKIITSKLTEGGAYLDIYRLQKDKCLLGCFPLHDAVELREVEEKWLRFCQLPWRQATDHCKDYFGEKIGLFFVFLGHQTTWFILPAFFGVFVWVNVTADDSDPNAATVPFYAVGIAIWSTLFLEFWKRKEVYTSMRWGMVGFEDVETDRPQFEGERGVSAVDGTKRLYFPRSTFFVRLAVSSNITAVLILVVLGVIGAIFYMRIILSSNSALTVSGFNTGSTIAALVNAIQIQVLNAIYGIVAVKLTDYENHRTDTQYEDALIGKTFMFQFVNSFATFFYVSFVKPYIQDYDSCAGEDCLAELSTALGTIFLTRLATGSLVKVLVPYIMSKLKERGETKGVEDVKDFTDVERQFMLAEYHVLLGPFADYANLAVQFGYATMFISAYPLAMALSLLTNYVEMRVDAWKLTQLCRRPEPRSFEDIGTWYTILELISFAAVLTNAAIVTFTGQFTINYTWTARVWIFFGFASGVLLLKSGLAILIPDVPKEVEIQLDRQSFFLSKIVDNVPDEDDTGLVQNIAAEVKYTIRVNDDDPL